VLEERKCKTIKEDKKDKRIKLCLEMHVVLEKLRVNFGDASCWLDMTI
jgi:hypothetical protein